MQDTIDNANVSHPDCESRCLLACADQVTEGTFRTRKSYQVLFVDGADWVGCSRDVAGDPARLCGLLPVTCE